jgi:hypothetical protein
MARVGKCALVKSLDISAVHMQIEPLLKRWIKTKADEAAASMFFF